MVLLFLLKLSFSPGRTGGFQLLRDNKTSPAPLGAGDALYQFLRSFLFFSALCRASDSLAYLEHRDSGDRETCGNEQLIELECAGRDVKLLYYLETFLFAAAR